MSLITRVSSRYQIVIPREVRNKLGIKEGDRIVFEIEGDTIKIRKVKDFLNLAGILKDKSVSHRNIREKAEEEIVKDVL
ncbi:MAG: AbrB/MazE/SpoVT family DNA-binding domain-containing protein [Aquificae bacterium]|nr:AbrB/MazE/SpoVT family DNA-binding domain-containing protein [Aquificota bacterium]